MALSCMWLGVCRSLTVRALWSFLAILQLAWQRDFMFWWVHVCVCACVCAQARGFFLISFCAASVYEFTKSRLQFYAS